MEIKTKYNIKDTVYFMYNNKAYEGKIINVYLKRDYKSEDYTRYTVNVQDRNGNFIEILEENLFSSKEELLKSL